MTQFLSTYGLAVVFANVLLDQAGLPIPAIPTLILAGALVAEGKLSGTAVIFIAVATTVIVEFTWYYAGKFHGNRIMKMLCRISLTPDTCVNQTQMLFERWGTKALIFANYIPGLSVITPPMAGATNIQWPRFLSLTILGAILWTVGPVGVGMIFSEQIDHILILLRHAGTITAIVVGMLLSIYIGYKWWERHRFFAMLRVARISVDELYQLMTKGAEIVIIDVRSHTARILEPRQIPGSLHVPLQAINQHVHDLPRDRDIVFYCTCPNEVSAAEATKILMDSGFERVRPLSGGLEAWIAAGYSIEQIDVEIALNVP